MSFYIANSCLNAVSWLGWMSEMWFLLRELHKAHRQVRIRLAKDKQAGLESSMTWRMPQCPHISSCAARRRMYFSRLAWRRGTLQDEAYIWQLCRHRWHQGTPWSSPSSCWSPNTTRGSKSSPSKCDQTHGRERQHYSYSPSLIPFKIKCRLNPLIESFP